MRPASAPAIFRLLTGWALVIAAGVLALLGGVYAFVRSTSNLHVVEAGVVYRSGQMPAGRLAELLRKEGIKSVINLRGAHAGEPWYDQERDCVRQAGGRLLDYPFSARKELTRQQLKEISELVRSAPKPVLIHCLGGADRTGLVCAVYCVDRGAASPPAQLSVRYGHFPYLLWEDAAAMDLSLDHYLRVIAEAGVRASR